MSHADAPGARAMTVLTIDRHPPVSLNAVLAMGWRERWQHNDLWKREAAFAWMNAGRTEFRRPVITYRLYYRGDRIIHDSDNLIGSVKPIQDGLTGRAFPNDDATTILCVYEAEVDNRHPRVEIELREREGVTDDRTA